MRRIVKFSLILSIFFIFSSQAVAADSYFSNSSEKFVSGIVNAATGWVELPKNIVLTSRNEGALYGATIGVATGIMHTVGRSLVGILDAVTFFIPTTSSFLD